MGLERRRHRSDSRRLRRATRRGSNDALRAEHLEQPERLNRELAGLTRRARA